MMWYWVALLADAFDSVILVDFLTRYFGVKPKVRCKNLFFWGTALLLFGMILGNRLYFDGDVRGYAGFLLPLGLYAVLCLGESPLEKSFAAVFTVSVYALLYVLQGMTVEALFDSAAGTAVLPREVLPRGIGVLLLAAVTRLLLFLRSRSSGIPWVLLMAFSGVSLSMAAALLRMVLFPDKTSAAFILYRVIFYSYAPYILLCAVGILVLNLAVYLLTAMLTQANRIRTENALLKQSRMYEEKSGEILRKTVEETRELRHDMKQHLERLSVEADALTTLEGDALREGIEHLREAFSDIHGRYASSGYAVYTGNRTLDALLTYKFGYAKECGIAVTMDITANASQVEDGDLCVILGNLLDNAAEACLRMPDGARELAFVLSEKESFLYLAVTNTTDGEVAEESRKNDGMFHGIGVKSVRKVVEKYGGMMRYGKTDGHRLTVEVLLRK